MGELATATWGINDIERAATYIVASRLFGVRNKEEAVALMLLAQAEGLHPMRAVQEYHIINGRPALRADAMLARFLQAGGKVEWHTLTDERVEATFSHPQGGSVRLAWTIDDAKRAGLLGKPGGNWEKYPRAMLRARVISEGVRTVYPAVVVGIYTPEEVAAMEPQSVEVRPAQQEAPAAGEGSPPPLPPAPQEGQAPAQPRASKEQRLKIVALLRKLGISGADEDSRAAALSVVSEVVGREVSSTAELTPEEAEKVIAALTQELEATGETSKE